MRISFSGERHWAKSLMQSPFINYQLTDRRNCCWTGGGRFPGIRSVREWGKGRTPGPQGPTGYNKVGEHGGIFSKMKISDKLDMM